MHHFFGTHNALTIKCLKKREKVKKSGVSRSKFGEANRSQNICSEPEATTKAGSLLTYLRRPEASTAWPFNSGLTSPILSTFTSVRRLY